MYLDLNIENCHDYAVFLNDILQTSCIEADDKKNYIKRYCCIDENGNPIVEKTKGNVRFVLIEHLKYDDISETYYMKTHEDIECNTIINGEL